MEISLHEFFEKVVEEKSINKKAEMLKDRGTVGLKAILRATYDKKVNFLIPDSPPPFEENDAPGWDLAGMKLEKAAEKIGQFVEVDGVETVQGKGLAPMRRESLFIQLLENLHPTEIPILLGAVRGRLPYKGITKRLVQQAFPGMIADD